MKKIAIVLISFIFLFFLIFSLRSSFNEMEKSFAISNNSNIDYESSGFSELPIKATLSFNAMDTFMTLTVYTDSQDKAQKALLLGKKEVDYLDQTLSTNDENSEIFRLNTLKKGTLGPDATYLMQRSLDFYKETNGIFDIAIYPILSEWGFTKESYKVPDPKKIKALLPISKLNLVNFSPASGEVIFSSEQMGIDYGGIAKGYTSSKLIKIFKNCGIKSAIINLGGNVHILNKKPNGSQFIVGIEDPVNSEQIIGKLNAENMAVITSGAYQRFFEKDGIRYHHIIDPRTGFPSKSNLTSVTIISKDGTLADAYSTTLYILGLEKAKAFWKTHQNQFDMILVDTNGQIYCTSRLENNFKVDSSQKSPIYIY